MPVCFCGDRRGCGWLVGKEYLLQHPQGISDSNENANACDGRECWERVPGADKHLEFGNKSAESGQTHRCDTGQSEGDGGKRENPAQVHCLQLIQCSRMSPVINHPADHGEQQPGDNSM